MSEQIHHSFNAGLRTAMADLFDEPSGCWVLLGCFWDGSQVNWKRLDDLTEAAQAHATVNEDEHGTVTVSTTGEVLAALAADLTERGEVRGAEALCGIAAVAIAEEDGARMCVADAAFIDGFRHEVTWLASEPAPEWEILSPIEQARDEPLPEALPDLLVALWSDADAEPPPVSAEQQQLSLELRSVLADRLADERHAVFIILAAEDGWVIVPPSDLTDRVRAKTVAGQDMYTALTELADELAADPLPSIPILQGFGTVVHVETDDGHTVASLAAVCDGTFHSAMWLHDEAAPDWEVIPAAAADPALAEVIALYQRLTDLIRGERR